MFTGKKFTGAPIAGLHLINDQQHALTAHILHPESTPHCQDAPRLHLDDFQQHRGCVVSERCFERIELIVRDMPEARRQGTHVLPVTRVPGCCQGAKRTAMVTTRGGNNVSFPSAHAGKFNGAFNGLRPGCRGRSDSAQVEVTVASFSSSVARRSL